MNEFFSKIFSLPDLYSIHWDKFLYAQHYYPTMGIIASAWPLLICIIFYFVLSTRFYGTKWWFSSWLLSIVINIISLFCFCWYLFENKQGTGDYRTWLQKCPENTVYIDFLNTAFSGAIWGLIVFLLFSLFFMWFSTHNRKVPFN